MLINQNGRIQRNFLIDNLNNIGGFFCLVDLLEKRPFQLFLG